MIPSIFDTYSEYILVILIYPCLLSDILSSFLDILLDQLFAQANWQNFLEALGLVVYPSLH